MSEPAFRNFSGLQSVSNAADQVAQQAAEKAQMVAEKAADTAEFAILAAQRLRDRLYTRWQQINERVVNEASHRLPEFKQELCDDAGYIADRARYYHETRPISALGVIASAAFVLGVAIGLGRH